MWSGVVSQSRFIMPTSVAQRIDLCVPEGGGIHIVNSGLVVRRRTTSNSEDSCAGGTFSATTMILIIVVVVAGDARMRRRCLCVDTVTPTRAAGTVVLILLLLLLWDHGICRFGVGNSFVVFIGIRKVERRLNTTLLLRCVVHGRTAGHTA